MREAFPVFGKKIKGFDTHDAVLTGVETRTSSPIRISRGEDLQSVNVRGLYPPAKAPATPAAFCRPGWTASRSPRRWRAACCRTPNGSGWLHDGLAKISTTTSPRTATACRTIPSTPWSGRGP
jgi:hypothetical protein